MTSDLRSRLVERLKDMGISEREASRRAGFGLSYVGDVISGRSKEPALARIEKLAEALECDVAWLLGRSTQAHDPAEARSFGENAASTWPSLRLIDLYSSSTVSNDLWVPMSPGAVDKVPVIPPLAHVDDAYAWSISTRQMEPRYYVGEVVYLHPHLTPRIDDFVLARRNDGTVAVGKLKSFTEDSVTLDFLSGETSTTPRADLNYIHRIIGSAG